MQREKCTKTIDLLLVQVRLSCFRPLSSVLTAKQIKGSQQVFRRTNAKLFIYPFHFKLKYQKQLSFSEYPTLALSDFSSEVPPLVPKHNVLGSYWIILQDRRAVRYRLF